MMEMEMKCTPYRNISDPYFPLPTLNGMEMIWKKIHHILLLWKNRSPKWSGDIHATQSEMGVFDIIPPILCTTISQCTNFYDIFIKNFLGHRKSVVWHGHVCKKNWYSISQSIIALGGYIWWSFCIMGPTMKSSKILLRGSLGPTNIISKNHHALGMPLW